MTTKSESEKKTIDELCTRFTMAIDILQERYEYRKDKDVYVAMNEKRKEIGKENKREVTKDMFSTYKNVGTKHQRYDDIDDRDFKYLIELIDAVLEDEPIPTAWNGKHYEKIGARQELLPTGGLTEKQLMGLEGAWEVYTWDFQRYAGGISNEKKKDIELCHVHVGRMSVKMNNKVVFQLRQSDLKGHISPIPETRKLCITLKDEGRLAYLIGDVGSRSVKQMKELNRINIVFANSGIDHPSSGLLVLKRRPDATYKELQVAEGKPVSEIADKSIVEFLAGVDEFGTQIYARIFESAITT